MTILLTDISKHFKDFTALDRISLEIPQGELVSLLGPSGCGKTTLLRIIAGLEQADSGQIILNGDDKTKEHASRRGIGFVFQHYALFRHMTVFDNVAFGLRVKNKHERPSEALIRHKVKELLELVQLGWLHDRYPNQLSGGQRQRIALARALAVEPTVLLLDEPFGALDASVRKDLRQWLRNLHHELNVTSIFVTHDQEEAMEVASRVVVMNRGKIEQQGTPTEIYDHPNNEFVSKFIGQTNILDVHDIHHSWLDNIGVLSDESVRTAHIRPQDIEILKLKEAPAASAILIDWQHLGSLIRVELARKDSESLGKPIIAEMPNEQFKNLHLQKGDAVSVKIRQAHWFH